MLPLPFIYLILEIKIESKENTIPQYLDHFYLEQLINHQVKVGIN